MRVVQNKLQRIGGRIVIYMYKMKAVGDFACASRGSDRDIGSPERACRSGTTNVVQRKRITEHIFGWKQDIFLNRSGSRSHLNLEWGTNIGAKPVAKEIKRHTARRRRS